MTTHETINTEAQVAPGGAAQVGGSRRRSDVWQSFHLSTDGGAVTATCKRCGETLRASSQKHGTSHLRRHLETKKCKKLERQQAPLLPAPQAPSSAEPAAQQRCEPQEKVAVSTPHGYESSSAVPVGDDYDEENFQGLPSIVSPRSERLLSSDFPSDRKNPTEEATVPGNMPQKAKRSLEVFFQKRREKIMKRAQLLDDSLVGIWGWGKRIAVSASCWCSPLLPCCGWLASCDGAAELAPFGSCDPLVFLNSLGLLLLYFLCGWWK